MLLPRGTKKENESTITCQQALKWFTALPVGFQEGGKGEYPVKTLGAKRQPTTNSIHNNKQQTQSTFNTLRYILQELRKYSRKTCGCGQLRGHVFDASFE